MILAPFMNNRSVAFPASLTALAAAWLGPVPPRDGGHAVPRMEQDLARRTGSRHAIGFATGREALVALLEALALPAGSGILVPAFTCPAVFAAVEHLGHRPVPYDVEPRTLGPDARDAARRITPAVRAFIVHHLLGRPAAQAAACARLAARAGLVLIEDCAQVPPDRQTGRLGAAALYSFESTKPVPAIRGGAVTTRRAVLARRVRAIRNRWPEPDSRWTAGVLAEVFARRALTEDSRRWMTPALARLIADHRLLPAGRLVPAVGRRMPPALAALVLHQLRDTRQMAPRYRARFREARPFGPPPASLARALLTLPVAARAWSGRARALVS